MARRTWFPIVVFGLLVFATRYPLVSEQLFSSGEVNLAYSIGHFDVRLNQPEPPGYPLFVMEMRVLTWLRFRRPESILLALTLAGCLAALLLVTLFGNRFLGGDTGYCAAWLLVLHPVLWHASLTSALRVQLAVVSVAVAAACWRAWTEGGRWVLWSALALAVGAGILPGIGPMLFPLWAVSVICARVSWKDRGIAFGAMAGVVMLWLVPVMLASGGPAAYWGACAGYVAERAPAGSGPLGVSDNQWRTTFWHILLWVFCSVPAWGLPAVLAWRPGEVLRGWGLGSKRTAFLTLWFLPSFAFAMAMRVADPGQTLAIAPPVALFGAFLVTRALDNVEERVSHWYAAAMVLTVLAIAWIVDRRPAPEILVWVPAVCIAAGVLLRFREIPNTGHPARWQMTFLMLAPVVLLNLVMFNHAGWYYKGSATTGVQAAFEAAKSDLTSGLALTSYEQIRNIVAMDDHTVREIRRLAGEKPGNTVIVWEHGLTAWRKAAYYLPGVATIVLDDKPPAAAMWRGPKLEKMVQGAVPLRVSLPAGARVVWLLDPRSDFYQAAAQSFSLVAAYPVSYTDLPLESGSRVLGEYEVAW